MLLCNLSKTFPETTEINLKRNHHEQECIAVGCVPTGAVATNRSQYGGGLCPGGLCPEGGLPNPIPDRQTNAS